MQNNKPKKDQPNKGWQPADTTPPKHNKKNIEDELESAKYTGGLFSTFFESLNAALAGLLGQKDSNDKD
jgi:hypothetical protein